MCAPQLRAALLSAAGRMSAGPGPGQDRDLLAEQMMVLFAQLLERTSMRTAPAPDPQDLRIRAVIDRLRGDLTCHASPAVGRVRGAQVSRWWVSQAASRPTQPSSAEPRVCSQGSPSTASPGTEVSPRRCTGAPSVPTAAAGSQE